MSTATTARITGAPKAPRILEKHVQEGVTALLELDGWRAIRTDPVSDRVRGKGFGELGMPDHLYLRYRPFISGPHVTHGFRVEYGDCLSETLWIEFKAPSKVPKSHQLQWHKSEQKRGALVLVIDNFDAFKAWYLASGLNRRIAA